MAYTHLQRYARPRDFADFAQFDRKEYYVAYEQHRDSDTATRSNFCSILKAIGGESETVLVLRDSHFAVGYVEGIYIHESDTTACEIANQILAKLEDYPIVNEDDWSELEWETAADYWEHMGIRERIEWCQKYRVSPFAARRNEIPEDPSGELISALAE